MVSLKVLVPGGQRASGLSGAVALPRVRTAVLVSQLPGLVAQVVPQFASFPLASAVPNPIRVAHRLSGPLRDNKPFPGWRFPLFPSMLQQPVATVADFADHRKARFRLPG